MLQTLDTKAHGKVAIHHFALAKAPQLIQVRAGAPSQALSTWTHACSVAVPSRTLTSSVSFAVQELHARFEPLLLFYIDGASLIEKGDDKWDVLLAVQHREDGCPALVRAALTQNTHTHTHTHRHTALGPLMPHM